MTPRQEISPSRGARVASRSQRFPDAPEAFFDPQGNSAPEDAGQRTSSGLADLMRIAEARRDGADLQGEIRLEPTLSYAYGSWSVRFKIAGPGGSYVVRSVPDLVDNVARGGYASYGKKLAFAHVPEAFDAPSRAMLRVVRRALGPSLSAGAEPSRTARRGDARDVPLSQEEAALLLDALEGQSFELVRQRGYGQVTVRASVTGEAPDLPFSLERASDGGYLVAAPDDCVLVRAEGLMFVLQGNAFHRCPDALLPCGDFLALAFDPDGEQPYIAKADLPLFCATLLPALEGPLGIDVSPELEALRPVPCELRFYFDRDRTRIVCEAKAAYGETEYRVGTQEGEPARSADPRACSTADTATQASAGVHPAPPRDEKREARAEALVERYFGEGWLPSPAELPLSAESEVAALLFGGLAEFRALGEVLTTPAFDRLLRSRAPRVNFGVSLAGDLLNLTVAADDLPPAELAALLASYRRRKRYHRLRDGAYLDLAECDLAQLDRMAKDLGISQAQLASGAVELPSYRAFYLNEEENLDRDRSFERYLERFEATSEESYRLPTSLADVLRPYQAEGFRWLSARCDAGFGGILADEMGLGKSLQIIALLLARRGEARETGPSLVVCPASLVYNWIAEFEKFAPGMRVCAVSGGKDERRRMLARAFGAGAGTAAATTPLSVDASEAEAAPGPAPAAAADGDDVSFGVTLCHIDVLVTSYDTLRADADALSAHGYYCCVLDEAQYIKNPATRITRAAKRLRARHRFALTGTPLENRLSDLWSIFDFLMPGLLGSYARFKERFELPIAGGDEDAAGRLRALAGPFMLRRRKRDVLTDLPEKLESTVYVALEGEQRRLYDACEQQLRERLTEQRRVKGGRGRAIPATPEARAAAATAAAAGDDFSKHRVEILAELTRLRQICCDPALLYEDYDGPAAKLQVVADLVASARDAGEKVLVFSQFTSFLSLIAQQLDLRQIAHYAITGATPKKKRLELVDAFNEDDTPAFLVSLKAGGTGLNLTGASVVIHADPWWNAAAQNQATDRTHRIGQTRAVTVQKVIAKDTIEERVQRLQEAKAALADQVIGASGTSLAGMTQDDLRDLLDC